MELAYVLSLVGCIYFVVFCRLALHRHERPQRPPGLMLVLSLPRRRGLDAAGQRYWRLYWAGWALMIGLLLLGLWWRHPHIGAALGG
jgi:hypothetical protein